MTIRTLAALALVGGITLFLTGCETVRPMTYAQWKAELARKARMAQLRNEANRMAGDVVFTKAEQEKSTTR